MRTFVFVAAGHRYALEASCVQAVHPLVREVSALFDATIVRIEAAGSLPSEAADAADDAADAATHGDHDV